MAIVYRVEHVETGKGPFMAYNIEDELEDVVCYKVRGIRPSPRYDGIDCTICDYHRVGCKDVRQLVHWFPKPAREWLRQNNFHIALYEVTDCIVLNTQVVFDSTKATKITTKPI